MPPPVIALFLTLLFCSAPQAAVAAPVAAPAYLDELIRSSRQQSLHESRMWHLLLKYRKTLLGGYESEADGKGYFNAPDGKTDPRAELEATLRSFFLAPADVPLRKEHPQCNFAARFKWLNRELAFDPQKLPIQKCDRLNRWLETLEPERVTVVFASHFLNNPASMFGHTLLRIDSKSKGKDRKLLNYGANYAAKPDTDNAVLYALKGLVGMFEGHFAIFPYYVKVQEYNNWESRDLWEYELNFTEDQLETLLLHLWELGGTFFEYYYFQENCSYHILSLLEVANPELHLRDEFFFSVIPTDTIKVLDAQKGLVKRAVYRPAVLSQMNHKRLKMTDDERRMFRRIIETPAAIEAEEFQALEVPSRVLILDAYLDYLQFQGMRTHNEEGHKVRIPRSVLLARSRLDTRSPEETPVRFSSRPDLGHGTDRVRFGVGHNDDEPFQEISYRPAYHDLLAKATGYDKDSEILVLDFNFRYYNETGRLTVDRAKILGITSLTPFDPLFPKPAWRLSVGVDTLRDLDCNYCNAFNGQFGVGFSYRPRFFSPFHLFAFLDAETDFSGDLEDNYRIGGGPEVGAFVDLTDDWRVQVSGGYKNFFIGDHTNFFTATFAQRYSLSQNLDLRLEYNRRDDNDEGVLSVNIFF